MISAVIPQARPAADRAACPAVAALAELDFRPDVLRQALLLEGEEQAALFALARERRRTCFPHNQVEVRSVIEISNICVQGCQYCGMARGNSQPKYLVRQQEFLQIVTHLYGCGRRVILVQSGENPSRNFIDGVSRCVAAAKSAHPDLEFILCLGNLSEAQYRQLRTAGADRYILKFETSNPRLYRQLKPTDSLEQRLACLEHLLALGYKTGSGNMVGLPGQSLTDLAEDIRCAGRYPLAMVSATVFIPGDDTPLRGASPGNLDWALNTTALLRILYPERLIPATSPFERLRPGGQTLALLAGANTVTIHDGTPEELKHLFPIYSGNRFTPNAEKLKNAVNHAGLELAKGPLI